ncbi:hypothetical protein [Mangrovibrevibacter kandeliae]|uniref:hypothetical protein n=1 Tax=Mangrovibrevibacter kandeliae TaxID=2968473 RepID=UPI0021185E39|nr:MULTISPECIES: hypothetical protein [unclassified Aurantimonas]MCQ8782507.1 hypothetical protein [Aurantimonas sp. CSK15Z-1]MCW4114684.1 hypothetical protein [Aurantimonas sp. MSK8Z-1]
MSSEFDRRAALEYVRDMLEQLKVVSGQRNKVLFYLLDMARLEAVSEMDRRGNGEASQKH